MLAGHTADVAVRVYARVSRNAAGYIPCEECGRVVFRNMTPLCRVPERTH